MFLLPIFFGILTSCYAEDNESNTNSISNNNNRESIDGPYIKIPTEQEKFDETQNNHDVNHEDDNITPQEKKARRKSVVGNK